jgi:non-specific serine/threonine protein kinase
LIIDEAQAIKNAKTKTSKFLKSIQADCKFALTGTPIENTMQELWSIIDFSLPGLLGSEKKFNEFLRSTLNSHDDNPFIPLKKLINPYILRRKKTDKSIISDLPDKIEMKAYCCLSLSQIKLYKNQMKELIVALKEMDRFDKRRRTVILSSLQKFKQICNHPSQVLGDQVYDPTDSGKFLRLKEIIEPIFQRGEKVLIFTQFRELTDILNGYLAGFSGRPGFVLHGGTPIAKRQEMVNEFQNVKGETHFILSLRAAGTGLNLTAANHVIHFDRWWNPAVEDQATDRAFRIGQKKNVMVHKFVTSGTIEERIDEMISEKKEIADEIFGEPVAGSGAKLTEMDDNDLINLVSLDLSSLSK